MDEQKRNNEQQQQTSPNQDQNRQHVVPSDFKPANDPGKDAAAKTERKGAGQQQESAGNPVVNS